MGDCGRRREEKEGSENGWERGWRLPKCIYEEVGGNRDDSASEMERQRQKWRKDWAEKTRAFYIKAQ